MIRTHYSSDLLQHKGEEVTIAGWVDNLKELPNLRFLLIRDREGISQVTVHKKNSSKQVIEASERLNVQDVIAVRGLVLEKQVAKVGPEVQPMELRVLSRSGTPLPIDITEESETMLDIRLDWRPLDLRKPRNLAIFKIQAKVMEAMQEYLRLRGYLQVSTPAILGGLSEGGSEVFKLDYFGSPAFLRQDPQLHRQLAIAGGLDKIYDLGPNWRAESSHTPRHLCEHRACAVEFGFLSDERDTERVEEELIFHSFSKVAKDCAKELETVGVNLEIPSLPFPELKFPDVYEIIREHGKQIEFGQEIDREDEQILARHVKEKTKSEFFYLNRFPFSIKPFYVMRVHDDPQWARSVDLIYKGMELSSGGQRENDYERLMEQVGSKGMDEKAISWFTENFRYGVPPHGGFALGIERTVMQMLGIENIREACLFPRTPERLTP